MSSDTLPISPSAFAEAIKELTLPTLYAKVTELTNSIVHLQRSNLELRNFVAESCENEADKRELEGYVAENEGVLEAMKARIQLCKTEVEDRGQTWIELNTEPSEATGEEGERWSEQEQGQPAGSTTTGAVNGTRPGPDMERLSDRGDNNDEEDGVYL
ncbi:hypothetical protein BJX70DRAFT_128819 [Aspergillus crustosus]